MRAVGRNWFLVLGLLAGSVGGAGNLGAQQHFQIWNEPHEFAVTPYVAGTSTIRAKFRGISGSVTWLHGEVGVGVFHPIGDVLVGFVPFLSNHSFKFDGFNPWSPIPPWGDIRGAGFSLAGHTKWDSNWGSSLVFNFRQNEERGAVLAGRTLETQFWAHYQTTDHLVLSAGLGYENGIASNTVYPVVALNWEFLREIGLEDTDEELEAKGETRAAWRLRSYVDTDIFEARLAPLSVVPNGILLTQAYLVGASLGYVGVRGLTVEAGVATNLFTSFELQTGRGRTVNSTGVNPALTVFASVQFTF